MFARQRGLVLVAGGVRRWLSGKATVPPTVLSSGVEEMNAEMEALFGGGASSEGRAPSPSSDPYEAFLTQRQPPTTTPSFADSPYVERTDGPGGGGGGGGGISGSGPARAGSGVEEMNAEMDALFGVGEGDSGSREPGPPTERLPAPSDGDALRLDMTAAPIFTPQEQTWAVHGGPYGKLGHEAFMDQHQQLSHAPVETPAPDHGSRLSFADDPSIGGMADTSPTQTPSMDAVPTSRSIVCVPDSRFLEWVAELSGLPLDAVQGAVQRLVLEASVTTSGVSKWTPWVGSHVELEANSEAPWNDAVVISASGTASMPEFETAKVKVPVPAGGSQLEKFVAYGSGTVQLRDDEEPTRQLDDAPGTVQHHHTHVHHHYHHRDE